MPTAIVLMKAPSAATKWLCDGAGACSLYDAGVAADHQLRRQRANGFACDGSGKCRPTRRTMPALRLHERGVHRYLRRQAALQRERYCDVADGPAKRRKLTGPVRWPRDVYQRLLRRRIVLQRGLRWQCEACDVMTAPGTCSPIAGYRTVSGPSARPARRLTSAAARACNGEQDTNSCRRLRRGRYDLSRPNVR